MALSCPIDLDTARFDCFAGTTKERTPRKYGVLGANVGGVKPARAS